MPETIRIKVIPRAKKNRITPENGTYKVHLTAPPERGKANKQLIKILSDYFGCRKSDFKIVYGEKAKNKLVERL